MMINLRQGLENWESGTDYSNDNLEETSKPDYREWLLSIFNGAWKAHAFKTLLNFDIFTEKVQHSFVSDVLKEVNGIIAPLGECLESNEDIKWYISVKAWYREFASAAFLLVLTT